jgi:hypothetical protein
MSTVAGFERIMRAAFAATIRRLLAGEMASGGRLPRHDSGFSQEKAERRSPPDCVWGVHADSTVVLSRNPSFEGTFFPKGLLAAARHG